MDRTCALGYVVVAIGVVELGKSNFSPFVLGGIVNVKVIGIDVVRLVTCKVNVEIGNVSNRAIRIP